MEKTIYTTLEQDIFNFSSKTKQELFEIYNYLSNVFTVKLFRLYGYNSIIEREDMKQLADIALWKIIDKYDTSKMVKFSTFAFNKMQNLIKDEIRSITHSRSLQTINTNITFALEEKYNNIEDTRIFDSREAKIIDSVTEILKESPLSKKSISIFTDAVLYQIPQKNLCKKYNISAPGISHHVRDVKRYLQKYRKYIDY